MSATHPVHVARFEMAFRLYASYRGAPPVKL